MKFVSWNHFAIAYLAVLWSYESPDNPYYHDPFILQAAIKTGDAIVRHMTEKGEWMHTKMDGSDWGYEVNDFLVQRWLRSYDLIKEALPDEVKARWQTAFTTSFNEVMTYAPFREEPTAVGNHTLNNAVNLYYGGLLFSREDWKKAGLRYIRYVISNQDPEGFWFESKVPVTRYGGVYLDALGVYYALSKDPLAYTALERASRYFWLFSYPNGHQCSVMDGRRHYERNIGSRSLGLGMTPAGRALLRRNYSEASMQIPLDNAAMFVQYAREAFVQEPKDMSGDTFRYFFPNRKALVQVKDGWRIYYSAYTAAPSSSPWILDLQNHMSVYHDRIGLILGGGNTKGTPLWSNYTAGDLSRVKRPVGGGKVELSETYPKDVCYLAQKASIQESNGTGPAALNLVYAENTTVRFACTVLSPSELRIDYSVEHLPENPAEKAVNFTFVPTPGAVLRTASGEEITLDGKLDSPHGFGQTGPWFEMSGCRISIPEGAEILWPAIPFDQYKKSGIGDAASSRVVLRVPVSTERASGNIIVSLLPSVNPK